MDDQTGASAMAQPFTLGAAAAAEFGGAAPLAPPPPPPTPAFGYAVLTRDVDGVGATGRVVCARAARIAGLIGSGDARAASEIDVDLAAPFHIVLSE